MTSFWLVSASLILDLSIGDPRSFPHPVRLFGRLARFLEQTTRNYFENPFWAGAISSLGVYSFSFFPLFFLLPYLSAAHPVLEILFSVFIIYTTIALRDLIGHSKEVYSALASGEIQEARKKVGLIVGRDTENLNESEIVRACVESVGENLVDGITAPLFFAILGGPAFAMLYKAINTLDSLFGYKNEKYLRFGTFPARIDDAANYIPARLTGPLLAISAGILGFRFSDSLRILKRDGRKHPSPNSGLSEAALAGALGVQLGGLNFYSGKPSTKPPLGDPNRPLSPDRILEANRIILLSSFLFLILCSSGIMFAKHYILMISTEIPVFPIQ